MDTFTLMIEAVILIVVVALLAMAIKIANQWERAVVLFLGRFVGIKGPGIFLIVPFLSRVAYWIDLRVITTSFNAEQTLTKDTVPVNVDAGTCSGRLLTSRKRRSKSRITWDRFLWHRRPHFGTLSAKPSFLTCSPGEKQLTLNSRD